MLEIDVEAHSAAPPERLWALLVDARTWPSWAPFDDAVVEQGEGVGELRRFKAGRVTTRERVTVLEPPRRFGYELVSGLPIRGYNASVSLVDDPAGGTRLRWRSSFAARLPGTGWLLRRRLGAFIVEAANGLARAAEQSPE
jgi:hypothetical protein